MMRATSTITWLLLIGSLGAASCQTAKRKGGRGAGSKLATVSVKEISTEDYDRMELRAWPAGESKDVGSLFQIARGQGVIEVQVQPQRTSFQLEYFKNDQLVLSSTVCGDDHTFDLKPGPNPVTIYVCDAGGGRFPPLDLSCDKDSPLYGPRILRLLTAREYQRTITSLTGITTDVVSDFPKELRSHGFDNQEANGLITDAHAEAHYRAAKIVSSTMIKKLSSYVSCSQRDASCAGEFIRSFGKKAWRGPINQEESAKLLTLFQSGANFDDGLERVIQGMLMAPRFLYRFELGELNGSYYELSSWEMAQAISYMFWGMPPDDQLMALADAGKLTDKATIAAEAKRLWKDARAKENLGYFASSWLGTESVLGVNKDAILFPSFDSSLRRKAYNETNDFFTHVVADKNGSFADLFQSEYTIGDGALSSLYDGVPTGGFIRYRSPERRGLLGHASILATYAGNDNSEPIKRGVFVLERLLCQVVPPPPPSLKITPPPRDPNASVRERFASHSTNPSCAICHTRIDGIGFGMEDMDAIGRFKQSDAGRPVDARGIVFGPGGEKNAFEGTAALGRFLATSAQAESCMSKQVYRFAAGQDNDKKIACAVRDLDSAFVSVGKRVSTIFLQVPTLDAFRRRQP